MHVLSHKHGPLQSSCLAAVDKATKSAVHMVSGRHCFQSHVQSDCHKERFARKTLKPKQLRNHRNLRFTRNVQGQTHFMGCYRTVIPRTSTDKAGYQCLIYMPPRTSTDKVFSSFFHHFQFPRTTSHGHPRSAFGSHGQPRTTAFCQNSQTFCEPQATGPCQRTQSRIHAGSSIQHSRACAGSTQDPSWDCVCPAAASLGLAVWDFRTGGGTGKIPSLILRLTLPACSVR